MSQDSLICPICASTEVKYNTAKRYWRCQNDECELTFDGEPPTAQITQQKIFLSYGHDENAVLVDALRERLIRVHPEVWIDHEKIKFTQDWRQKITDGILSSHRVLSFLSQYSVRDPGVCLDEIGIALSTRHGAIATLLVEPEKDVKIPASVAHIQYLNLSDWKNICSQGETIWNDWLDKQAAIILDVINKNSSFAGDMDALQKLLTPIPQWARLGMLVEKEFIGRQWLFDELEAWRIRQTGERLFFITGAPGMGKSAISAHLAHFSKLHAVAYHFCRWDEAGTRDPKAFIGNLAFQLAARIPNYRSRLKFALTDMTIQKNLVEYSQEELFSQLIAEPLRGIDGGQSSDRLLLVVDALDEAPEIAELLGKRLNETPPWLGVVATSRPETQILSSLGWSETAPRLRRDDERNQADLTAYIDIWFKTLRKVPPADAMAALLIRSEGNINYLALAREGHAQGIFDLAHPESYPKGLSKLYREWFNRQFIQAEAWNQTAPVLRILCASPEPLPESIATQVLGWRNEDKRRALSPLGALVRLSNGVIELAHRSLAEWLQDYDMADKYWINPTEGRIQLATRLWQEIPKLVKASSPEYGHIVLPGLLLKTEKERWHEILGKGAEHLTQINSLSTILEHFHTFQARRAQLELAEFRVRSCETLFNEYDRKLLSAKQKWASLLVTVSFNLEQAQSILSVIQKLYEQSLGPEHPATLTTMSNLASTLYSKGDYEGARILQERVLAAREKTRGTEHPDTLKAMNRLATTLYAQGSRTGARTLKEKELAIRKQTLGAEHIDTLAAMSDLASTFYIKGDRDDRKLLQEKLLCAREHTLGAEHPKTLLVMSQLAKTLFDQGDLDNAKSMQKKVLAARERVLGTEHPATLTAMSRLAITLFNQGNLVSAKSLQEKVLATRERIQGPEHPATLTAMAYLAETMVDQGDRDSAIAIQKKVLATRERIQGAEHPDTLTAMSDLAGSLSKIDPNLAKTLEEKVLAVRERVQGPEHPDTLWAMSDLAITLFLLGDRDKAKTLQEKLLVALERILGPEHPDTTVAMINLAHTLYAQGNRDGAKVLLKNVLATRKRIFGPMHSETVKVMNKLVSILRKQGDATGAVALKEKILGPEHPETLEDMSDLAITLSLDCDYDGAKALQEKILAVREKILGPEHTDTLAAMNDLAGTLSELDDLAGAKILEKKVLEIRERILGYEHPDTLTAMSNLASTLHAQSNLDEARALKKKVLTIREKLLGSEHPDTLKAMQHLAATLRAGGDLTNAKTLWQKLLSVWERTLGPEDRKTLTVMHNLANTLFDQKDWAGARVLQEKIFATQEKVKGLKHPITIAAMNNLANTLKVQGDLAGLEALQKKPPTTGL